ncbi:MAG: hypothetical protein EP298_11435, partial [Gammaproteobacteria bacterium]
YTLHVNVTDNGHTGVSATVDNTTIDFVVNNVAPASGGDLAIAVDEGSSGNIIATADLAFSDVLADTIIYRVDSLTTNGTLYINGIAASINDTFSQGDINSNLITYDHNGSETTSDSFTFSVLDEDGGINSPNTFNITVNLVNDPPESTDNTVTVLEDSSYIFELADFGFNDVDSASLESIKIVSLETAGSLILNGINVVSNQIILSADIALGNLVFTPESNENGLNYSQFTFTVSDGLDDSIMSYTITIHVTEVNDPPEGIDKTINILQNKEHLFSHLDFDFTDLENHNMSSVIISNLTLPSGSSLELDSLAITTNQEISTSDLARLIFKPAINEHGTDYASFEYQLRDDGGTTNGGIDLDPTPNVMTINVTPNEEPLIDEPTFETRQSSNIILHHHSNKQTGELTEELALRDLEVEKILFENNFVQIGNNYESFIIRVNENIIAGSGTEGDPFILNVQNFEHIFLLTSLQANNLNINVLEKDPTQSSFYSLVDANENDIYIRTGADVSEISLQVSILKDSQKVSDDIYYKLNINQNDRILSAPNSNQKEFTALIKGENNYYSHLLGGNSSQDLDRLASDLTNALNHEQSLSAIEKITSRLLSSSTNLNQLSDTVDFVMNESSNYLLGSQAYADLTAYMILNIESDNRQEVIQAVLNNQHIDSDLILNIYQVLLEKNKEIADQFLDTVSDHLDIKVADNLMQFRSIAVINPGYLSTLKESLLSDSERDSFNNLDGKQQYLIHRLDIERTKQYLLKLFSSS